MSNMKNGFSTLNRWLGKKNKDKAAINGKLSKSNTNLSLSVSTTNINETSQLEYNRITPLPAATSNAPFEQTFRITVLLPKEQLYVSRLGARVPLSKLLELVCENKQLDADKYEFRNPVDPSQVYSCDLTIGAVGLSEIRLCNKSESYDTFNADEVIKLHRTSIIRDSLSSSEFSSRNSKHTTKTASPYSSSNSLNSMDSTGMNYTRIPLSLPPALPATTPPKMLPVTAPPRKKRTAPRPPSQTAIPEKSTLVIENKASSETIAAATMTEQHTILPRKDYYVSTPNLASPTLLPSDNGAIDCNGNQTQTMQNNCTSAAAAAPYDDVNQLYAQVEKKNARNLYRGSVQNLSTTSDQAQRMPEPSPRKRLIQIKKKSSAPAPPPRSSSMYATEDSLSIVSTTPSTPDTPTAPFVTAISEIFTAPVAVVAANDEPRPQIRETPKPQERESVAALKPQETATSVESVQPQLISRSAPESPINVPKPVPRLTTNCSSTTLLNAASAETATAPCTPTHNTNVSKVMLNRTPTPEPRSLSCEPPPELRNGGLIAELKQDITVSSEDYEEDDDNISKQADSGIGEPVPSPIPPDSSLPPSEGSTTHEFKSNFESSSDDDDMIKVYNFKLGKTSIKMDVPKMLEELAALEAAATDSGGTTPALTVHDMTPSITDASSWNFTIPISPPPNFADNSKTPEVLIAEQSGDAPITPKIKERPVLNFEALTTSATEERDMSKSNGSSGSTNATQTQQQDVVDHRRFDEEKSVHKMATLASPTLPVAHTQKHTTTRLINASSSSSTPMSDIVDELSTIIHEKRIDSLIRKVEDHGEIKAAKPNTLSNFSITAIGNNTQQPTLTRAVEKQSPNNDANTPSAFTSEFPYDEEKLYSKNGSANHSSILRDQRKAVTRADSFHSTAATTRSGMQTPTSASSLNKVESPLIDGLNSRSSSYLSLTKIEQNGLSLSRRRSSSELSIGESPSLQSLEVIKTILNSRKNSLANSSDGSGGGGESMTAASLEIINQIEGGKRTPTEETKITSVQLKPKSSVLQAAEAVENRTSKPAERTTKQVEVDENVEEPITREVPKEIPKVYRYSGPPSINFSTWSERPKAQVSIKNEGDYIFGGKTTGNQNVAVTKAAFEFNVNAANAKKAPPTRNYRASTPASAFQPHLKLDLNKAEALRSNESVMRTATTTPNTPPAVAPKPAASPTKRMGIPEKEFRVPLTVKPLADVTVESIATNAKPQEVFPQPSEQNKTSRTTVTFNRVAVAAPASLPHVVVHEVIKRPLQTNASNTSTLPRASTNRFSMPAVLLRSTSITQLEAQHQPKAVGHESPPPAAPFGQNTLRKTGLKEKILAKEEAAAQKAKIGVGFDHSAKSAENYAARNTAITQNGGGVGATFNGHVKITTTATKTETPNSPPNKTLQSAKLELKLQNSNTTSVYLQPSTATFTKPQTPKMATSPTPPPPPPPAILKNGIASKSKHTISINGGGDVDPRDQLLAAIRNFKRDELNRA